MSPPPQQFLTISLFLIGLAVAVWFL